MSESTAITVEKIKADALKKAEPAPARVYPKMGALYDACDNIPRR